MGTVGAIGLAVVSAFLGFIVTRLTEPFRTQQAWQLDNAKQLRDVAKEILRCVAEIESARDHLVGFIGRDPDSFDREASYVELREKIEALRKALSNAGMFISPQSEEAIRTYLKYATLWDQIGRGEQQPADRREGISTIGIEVSDAERRIGRGLKDEVLNFFKTSRRK